MMKFSLKYFAPVALGLGLAAAFSVPGTAQAATPPHFATPLAAMQYMADAYNRGEVAAMHHVTTPYSFRQLQAMHSEAVSLKVQWCHATGRGDYDCHFQHRYPKSFHDNGYGASDMIVAPALTPGWYMYALEECG